MTPRRLNLPLFNRAIEQPLEIVFQRHQQELARIPGEKVVEICKKKLRKMRSNYIKKDPETFRFG